MSSEQSNNKNALIRDAAAITLQSVNKVIPLINELADEFYMGPEQGAWIKLQQVIEIFETININTGVLASNHDDVEGMSEYMNIIVAMQDKLNELLKALEKSDMVLAGDLLSYEIIPMLEAIRNAAEDIVCVGVDKDVSNREH